MKDAPDGSSHADTFEPIPSRKLFPGEDQSAYDALRTALMEDLAPQSFYERQMAENIVDLEWDSVRYRNLRADLVRAEAKDVGAQCIADADGPLNFGVTKHTRAISAKLFRPDGPDQEAVDLLDETSTTFNEVVARAYAKGIMTLSHIERHLSEMEQRRRRLLDDYQRLKARRSDDIPDAEIIDSDGD